MKSVTTKNKKYRVSTGLKDFDFVDAEKAKSCFERINESASLWKRIPTRGFGPLTHLTPPKGRLPQIAWHPIKWKRVDKYGESTYFDY